jgi:hypothetical protein
MDSAALTEACGWQAARRCIVRDRDGAYGEIFVRCLAAMGIRDRPIAARSPWQNGYAERVIGSIHRDCLDHVMVLGEEYLRHLLNTKNITMRFARTSLSKRTRPSRVEFRGHRVLSVPILGGLHHQYVRI